MRRRSARVATLGIAAALVVALAACSGAGAGAGGATPPEASPAATVDGPTPPTELTILGAASLKDALAEVKAAYEAANPGTTLTFSTDSSAALETQIEQGAPADVFLSADAANPRKLADAGLAGGDPVSFAGNELALIVPADNPAGIGSAADLARPGVKVVGAGDEVPITNYANLLVANLAQEAGYPAGFAAAYAANLVSKEDNVKAIVAKVELGEGDAGIVYVTDAAASDAVRSIAVPESANVTAVYNGVVLRTSRDPAAARTFLAWLAGPEGQAILAGFGFRPPAR